MINYNAIMKKILVLSALTAGIIAVFNSCCKDPGDDGDATLVVRLKHHGVTIPNQASYPDSVFVKFDAEESPGTSASSYDRVYVGEGTEDHVHIEGLKCGKYFIYGAGYDTNGPYRVFGGMAIKIKHKDRKKETVIDLAVAE